MFFGLEIQKSVYYTISINNYTINCCPEKAQSKRMCYRRNTIWKIVVQKKDEIIAHVQFEMVLDFPTDVRKKTGYVLEAVQAGET